MPTARGTHAPPPVENRVSERHGRWEFRYESDEISEIAADGIILIESLRPTLRDRDWGTVVPQIVEETWDHVDGALTRTLNVHYEGAGGHAVGRSDMRASEDRLSLRFTFTPTRSVTTNRVGITAMLPRALAGDDARVTTPGGDARFFRFPTMISPWQPLFDISVLELSHARLDAHLEFSGDVFEMEDQRNWTDASYKIYNRPLALPFPYTVAVGETVVQEVVLTIRSAAELGKFDASVQGNSARVYDLATLLDGARPTRMPRIGLGTTTSYAHVGSTPLLETDTFDHLMIEASPRFPVGEVLATAAREAEVTGLPVDLRIIGSEDTDVSAVLTAADDAGLTVVRVGVFDESRHVTTSALWQRLQDAADGRDLELVAGARTHFAEFNREIHTIPTDADAYTFPSTPQMHMRETWHVAESLAALADVLDSARALHPHAPIVLGPVTLRPRVNAVATQLELVDRADASGYGAHLVPDSVDPRQETEWAGAWAGSVLATAAKSHVRTVTMLELAGPRGILRSKGERNPAGEVIARMAAVSGDDVHAAVDFAGSGSSVIRHGNELAVFNARLDAWILKFPGSADGHIQTLEVPAASYRMITLSQHACAALETGNRSNA